MTRCGRQGAASKRHSPRIRDAGGFALWAGTMLWFGRDQLGFRFQGVRENIFYCIWLFQVRRHANVYEE